MSTILVNGSCERVATFVAIKARVGSVWLERGAVNARPVVLVLRVVVIFVLILFGWRGRRG